MLDYPKFRQDYKITAIDLSKVQKLDPNTRAIQQINFTGNLDQRGNTTVLFITEEVKETILRFSQGTVRALQLSKLKSGKKMAPK